MHFLVVQADPLAYPAELFSTERKEAVPIKGLRGEYVLRRTLPLDLDTGWEMIDRGIKGDQPMRLVRLYPPTARRLEDYVIRSNNNGMPIDVLHFSCHGDLFKYGRFRAKPGEADGEESGRQGEDRGPDEVKLLLENQDGVASPYGAEDLAGLIALGGENSPQLVILDACYSGFAKPDAEPIFVEDFKKALAEADAPAPTVIGMTKEVDVGFAASYAAQLYRLTSLKMGFKEAHKEALDRAQEDYRKKTGATYGDGKPEIILEGTVRRDLQAGEPEIIDQKRPPAYPARCDPPGTFTGREEELVRIARLLNPAEGIGSACIRGPGGTGKTALAQAALSRNAWRYAGENQRIAWVSLYGVSTEEGLIEKLGTGLGLEFKIEEKASAPDPKIGFKVDENATAPNPKKAKKNQISDVFKTGYHLIILDNLESILVDETGEAMALVEELERNPRVFVLMTSRQKAGASTHEVEVQGLGGRGIYLFSNVVKRLGGEQTRAYQETSDSLNWIDCSVNQEAPATKICDFLENDPLMIEQVASNLVADYEPFDDVLKKMKEGEKEYFEVYGAEADPRHVTQAACFRYSYDRLLEGSAREVLTAAACLPAGFLRSTLEDIVSEPKKLGRDLKALLARSLLKREEISENVAVYGMHRVRADLALEFEEEKRRREILEKAASKVAGLTSIVFEKFEAGHSDEARFCAETFILANASRLLSEPIVGLLNKYTVSVIERYVGGLLQNFFRYDEAEERYKNSLKIAEELYEDSVKIGKELGDRAGVAWTLHAMGWLYHNTHRYNEAEERYNESLEIEKELGDRVSAARTLHQLGILYFITHRYDEAGEIFKESLETSKGLGDRAGAAMTLHQLGMLYHKTGRPYEAEERYEDSLKISESEELNDRAGAAMTLHQLGMLYDETDRDDEAEKRYNASLEINKELGDRAGAARTLHQLGILYHDNHRNYEAEINYKENLEVFKELGDRAGVAMTLGELGSLYQNTDRSDEAEESYNESLEINQELGNRSGAATILHGLGKLYSNTHRYDDAEERYKESSEINKELGDRARAATTLNQLGKLYLIMHRYDDAEDCFKTAIDIFKELRDAKGASRVLGRYAYYKLELGDVTGAISLATQSAVFALNANDTDLVGFAFSMLRELKEKVPPDEMRTQIRETLAELLTEDEETLGGNYDGNVKLLYEGQYKILEVQIIKTLELE